MSFAQQGLWLLQQLPRDQLPTTYAYVPSRGTVDKQRLQNVESNSWNGTRSYERRWCKENGMLVQRLRRPADMPLPWRKFDYPQRRLFKRKLVWNKHFWKSRASRSVGQAPLWRCLDRTGRPRSRTRQDISSTISGRSRTLSRAGSAHHAASGRAEMAALPHLKVQYTDYAAWQRQRLTGERFENTTGITGSNN